MTSTYRLYKGAREKRWGKERIEQPGDGGVSYAIFRSLQELKISMVPGLLSEACLVAPTLKACLVIRKKNVSFPINVKSLKYMRQLDLGPYSSAMPSLYISYRGGTAGSHRSWPKYQLRLSAFQR